MNQMNWLEWEYKRRLRQARWFFFILGAIFGFVFGLMADGAHAAYHETPFIMDHFWTH